VAATPTFQVTPGSATTLPTLTISDTTIGSTLFYTTDGTTPTTSSIQYGGPFTVASGVTVKAIATASGYVNSNVASITLSLQTTPPAFSPAAGSYAAPLNVTLSDITPGAAIYYTTSGAAPSASSTPYTAPIPITGATTIQAIAIANGYTASPVVSASYALSLPTAATPTFSPAAGSLLPNQTVTIADATAGATIFYTTDGSTPSASSPQYSGPISVTGTETISAIAVASGYTNSAVARAIYTINGSCLNNVTTNANGNITNVPTADGTYCAVFTYNAANRAASITGTSLAASMVYDWAGQRYSKTNGGVPPTVFSYMQGGTLIAENDGGIVTDYVYVDGRPIAILQPGASVAANQVNYVLADRLGTPLQVANSAATPVSVWSTIYTPFGTTGTITASINQGLRLPGQYADVETGFNYNLNRDYMPNLDRYLEVDPIGIYGGINSYVYALANPLFWVDASGLRVSLPFIPDTPKNRFLYQYESSYDEPNVFSVEGHGNSQQILGDNGFISPDELAQRIFNDRLYWPGMTIRLISCNTGSGANSYAQQLANAIERLNYVTGRDPATSSVVYAPNGFVVIPDGVNATVRQPNGQPGGYFPFRYMP
jgi:RHS repeat-associated protein